MAKSSISADSNYRLIYVKENTSCVYSDDKSALLNSCDVLLLPPHNSIDLLTDVTAVRIVACNAFALSSELKSLLPDVSPITDIFRRVSYDALCILRYKGKSVFTDSIAGFFSMCDSQTGDVQRENFYTQFLFITLLNLILSDYTSYDLLHTQSIRSSVVVNVLNYIDHNYKTASLTKAASIVKRSPEYICRRMLKETGKNFNDILSDVRLRSAALLLSDTDFSEESICESVGYTSLRYFRIIFENRYGCTPLRYRKSLIRTWENDDG